MGGSNKIIEKSDNFCHSSHELAVCSGLVMCYVRGCEGRIIFGSICDDDDQNLFL